MPKRRVTEDTNSSTEKRVLQTRTTATAGASHSTFRNIFRLFLASKAAVIFILVSFVIPLAAFEAHVINVTATIERRPSSCDALSIGYWRNHEGCTRGGGGSSVWASQVNILSATFSSVFGAYTGEQICGALWVPDCPSGNSVPSKLCRAKAMALADELNTVSSRLDLAALIAGADDGSSAFDNLGLTSQSTVSQALAAVEAVIANPSATAAQLTDAATVAERIYSFYEDENPTRPACVYSWDETTVLRASSDEETATKDDSSSNAVIFEANILETLLFGGGGETEPVATSTEPIAEPEGATSTENIVQPSIEAAIETQPTETPPSESPPESPPSE